jgi:hypothetical protein
LGWFIVFHENVIAKKSSLDNPRVNDENIKVKGMEFPRTTARNRADDSCRYALTAGVNICINKPCLMAGFFIGTEELQWNKPMQ